MCEVRLVRIKLGGLMALGLLAVSCSAPYVRVNTQLVNLKREIARDVTCSPQYASSRANLTVVALRAPDSCTDKAASTQTGKAQQTEEVLRTRCGVEMAEVERALTRQGYVVTSWRDLASMVTSDKLAAKDAALKLNAQVLFQVNSLEKVKLPPEDARWERSFYVSDKQGDEGVSANLDEKGKQALRELVAPKEKEILERAPFGAMLDVSAVSAQTGQTIWFYRWAKGQPVSRDEGSAHLLARRSDARWLKVDAEGESATPIPAAATGKEDDTRYFTLLRDVVSDFANEFHAASSCSEAKAASLALTETGTRASQESPASALGAARALREKGLRSEEEQTYLRCVKLDGKFAACHFGLFEVFHQDRREAQAKIACMNVVKFADPGAMKDELATCEKFLRSAR